jgi:hypothetical protein
MSLFIVMPEPVIETSQDAIVYLLHQQVIALLHHPEFNVGVIIEDS